MTIGLEEEDLGATIVENQVTPRIPAGNSMENPWTGSLAVGLLSVKAVGMQPQQNSRLHPLKLHSPRIKLKSFRG